MKTMLRNLALNGAIVIVSVVLSMWALDAYIAASQPVAMAYEYAPGVDYRLRPHEDFRFTSSEYDSRVTTNSLGLRGGEPDLERQCRVVVLGDSFAFGQGVSDNETFSAMLQAKLDEVAPKSYAVINTGHNGYDTRREAEIFDRMGARFRPNLVVTGFVMNDPLSTSGEYYFSPVPSNFLRFLPFKGVAALLEYLRRNPRELAFKLGLPVHWDESNHWECLKPGACTKAWEATRGELARIKHRSDDLGAPMLLLNIPVRQQLPGEPPAVADTDVTLPGRLLEADARTLGIGYLDLQAEPALRPEHYFPRDGHFRPAGNAVVAERLLPQVLTMTQDCRAAVR